MKKYILRPTLDEHGQPKKLFRAQLENNISKAIDQLSGICTGILADGVVNHSEATFFAEWVQRHASLEPVWPFTEILARINRIFADGIVDDEERDEMRVVMEALIGFSRGVDDPDPKSSHLPVDRPLPTEILFPGRMFALTGRFAYGTRKKVIEAIAERGGVFCEGHPNRNCRYLVIGCFASRDWYNTNYGRKIERAVELRTEGSGISIIGEDHWRQFL